MSHYDKQLTSVPIITIDGPGGSGKGTLSWLLAQKLGWHFLDSGSLYRVLALYAENMGADLTNEMQIARLAAYLPVEFKITEHSPPAILLNRVDVSHAIRTEQCATNASIVAALPKVRAKLLALQRAFAKPPGLITDGRDMGSVVFKDAAVKIYLFASQEERARRRVLQLKNEGHDLSFAEVLAELQARDERDRVRAIAPLKPADDALVVDTTQLNRDQVFATVYQHIIKKLGHLK